MIHAEHLSGDEWLVTVTGTTTTKHRVRVTKADINEYVGEETTTEQLLTASFQFLLEREPNTSILSSFELPVIGKYFPEYRKEIQRYLQ